VKRLFAFGATFVALLCTSQHGFATLIYGIQPATGQIITIDPSNGVIVNSFATPAAINPNQTYGGLTYAQQLGQLLYFNSAAGTTLYRLDPGTGAVLGTAFGDGHAIAGLSYQSGGTGHLIFHSHPVVEIRHQTGFGGSTNAWGPGRPVAGLGGDGYGREFGLFGDLIREYDPFTDGALIGPGFPAPGGASGARGLAFDGSFLYVSTAAGDLLTLDPDTGAVLNSVAVAGGALVELGANQSGSSISSSAHTPEPATVAVFGALAAGAFWVRRRARGGA
jgi:hypothetical protein